MVTLKSRISWILTLLDSKDSQSSSCSCQLHCWCCDSGLSHIWPLVSAPFQVYVVLCLYMGSRLQRSTLDLVKRRSLYADDLVSLQSMRRFLRRKPSMLFAFLTVRPKNMMEMGTKRPRGETTWGWGKDCHLDMSPVTILIPNQVKLG